MVLSLDKAVEAFGKILVPLCLYDFDFMALKALLCARDRLAMCLSSTEYGESKDGMLNEFEASGFLVCWRWLLKGIKAFGKSLKVISIMDSAKELTQLWVRFETDVSTLNDIICDATGSNIRHSFSDVLWKKGGHPLNPPKAYMWESIITLKRSARECSLRNDEMGYAQMMTGNHPYALMSLQEIMTKATHDDIIHPIIHINQEMKKDILTGLCTIYWATTDELRNNKQKEDINQKAPGQLPSSLDVEKVSASCITHCRTWGRLHYRIKENHY